MQMGRTYMCSHLQSKVVEGPKVGIYCTRGKKRLWQRWFWRKNCGKGTAGAKMRNRGGGEAAQKRSHKKFETFFFPVRCPPFCHSPSIGRGGSVVVSCGDVIPAFLACEL